MISVNYLMCRTSIAHGLQCSFSQATKWEFQLCLSHERIESDMFKDGK